MTKQKKSILRRLSYRTGDENGAPPYSAQEMAMVLSMDMPNANQIKTMRRRLNAMVDDGLLFRVSQASAIFYHIGEYNVEVEMDLIVYDLIEFKPTKEEV